MLDGKVGFIFEAEDGFKQLSGIFSTPVIMMYRVLPGESVKNSMFHQHAHTYHRFVRVVKTCP